MSLDRARVRLLIAGAVVLAAFSYLFVTGMRSSQVYYLTVSEYRTRAAQLSPTEPFRISGRVLPGSVEKSADGVHVRFAVYDPAAEAAVLPVAYHGVIPDTFMEGSEVVVEGSMVSDQFAAHTLLAKCPSKYEAIEGGGSGEATDARGAPRPSI
jgi:cytochrome c-type biogenesis protein CcmE